MGIASSGIGFEYTAPPTCAAFAKSNAYGRIIAGPVGSGKTTACVIELLRRSCAQAPAADGKRYTRYAITRQTLKQLKDTVLKDCQQWLAGMGNFKVQDNTYYLDFDDIRSEWIFIPLENADDQARLLSMQLTGAWLSECIEMDISVLAPISGRIGRYPSGLRGSPTWQGIIADTNMPTEMSPWYLFMEGLPPEWQKFVQPSGLSPEAENLNHLVQTAETSKLPIDHPARLAQGRKYYERFINMHGEDSDWVQRYVHAQYGNDPSSEAVFRATFRPDFHIVDSTLPIPGYPLLIGQDFGRNPWSLICQMDHMGRLIVLEEVPATNVGLEKHVNERLKPRLYSDRYLGYRIAVVGDPAGVSKDSLSEETHFDALKRLGLPAFPAPTNNVEPRLMAVEALLCQHVGGGPSLVIDRDRCPMLVRAMAGGYRFAKTKQGANKPLPEKNDPEGYSHVADCLQYVALVVHGNIVPEIVSRLRPQSTKRREVQISPQGWT